MRKADVQTHYDHGERLPAVNVKVHMPYGGAWRELARTVALDHGDDIEQAEAFASYVDESDDIDPDGWLFGHACEMGWEQLREDVNAENVFGA